MLHRFFISAESFRGDEVVLTGPQAHKICHVLRLKDGDYIVVLDNTGVEFEVVLTALAPNKVTGRVLEKREATGEPHVQITLYQSLLSRDKFEWVLQKCTEVGVSRFVPVVTNRTIVRDSDHTKADKLERWRRIITSAAEQSHRGRIPELTPPTKLEEALAQLTEYDLSLMASTDAECTSLHNCLQQYKPKRVARIALFIGPEGGFTKQEEHHGTESGAICFNLGRRILRTETAAVVAGALILYELDQLQG